jgi:signal peptidase I
MTLKKPGHRKEFYYPEKQAKRHQLLHILAIIIALLFLYIILTSFVFSNRVIETNSMQNDIKSGDRIIFSSRTIFHIFPGMGKLVSPQRGDVVLLNFDENKGSNLVLDLLAPFVRFFTAQRIDIGQDSSGVGSNIYIKRIIGIPGDTVTMEGSVFRVKPANSPYTLTEFELSGRRYDPLIPNLPPIWDSSLPLSGSMSSITLGAGQYFVAADDRSDTNDSRTWGLISLKQIEGTALFRYWPLTRMGKP